jgi:hypothetical protein
VKNRPVTEQANICRAATEVFAAVLVIANSRLPDARSVPPERKPNHMVARRTVTKPAARAYTFCSVPARCGSPAARRSCSVALPRTRLSLARCAIGGQERGAEQ